MNETNELIARTPEPPYYVVVFTSLLRNEVEGYKEMASQMTELAAQQSGFLGVETAREDTLFGITVSYWKDEESILAWRDNADHQWAKKLGKEKWYQSYMLRIARVEQVYGADRKSS